MRDQYEQRKRYKCGQRERERERKSDTKDLIDKCKQEKGEEKQTLNTFFKKI